MDHETPKTRKELKGTGKQKQGPYSSKRVRQLEALAERRAAAGGKAAPPPAKK